MLCSILLFQANPRQEFDKQPEKVRFYKLEDGTFLIDIPEMMEIEQNIDVAEMFK